MKNSFFHITFLLFLCVQTKAQNGLTANPDWQIKPSVSTGFIMVHRATINHLVKGYPTTYEFNVSKPSLGNKLWHHENNMPDFGLSFQFIDFKNPEQLGYAYVLAPYIEIPLNKEAKLSRLVMRLCWGITYMDNSFDVHENHKNIAIGSSINAYVQFKWFWQIPINKYLRFEPGIAFNHASNGKAKNPNLGLNMASLNASLNILIPSKRAATYTKVDSNTKARSKNELMSFVAYGINQREVGSPELRTFVWSTAYQRNVRNTHKFSAGCDFFYDENYAIDYENVYQTKPTGIDQIRISARLGYSYNVGRISFPIEIGYYVFQKTNPDAMVVSRIGVRYYGKNGLVAHFGLRTHFAVAYNFEYGVGYRYFLK